MKKKIAKAISIVTLVPIMAALTSTWLFTVDKTGFENKLMWYMATLFFLTFLPISAYPLKHLFPAVLAQGRSGERKLAFIMAVAGYVIGTIACIVFRAPKLVMRIFLGYLFSGGVLAFINKVVRLKASGHACGVSGPLMLLIYSVGAKAWWIFLLIPVVFWARLQLGRHTYSELFAGTAVGVFSTLMAIFVSAYI